MLLKRERQQPSHVSFRERSNPMQEHALFTFRWLAVAVALLAVAAGPVAAQGNRDQLMGTYFSTGEQTCLVSPYGFTNQAVNNVLAAFLQSSSVQGTVSFQADGVGTAQFREVQITHPPATTPSASSSEYTFSFTYEVADDGTLTLLFGSVSGRILTGSMTGREFILTNLPPLRGRVERNGTAIALTSTDPNVEILTLQSPTLTLPRICHRSRALIPIHVDEHD